MYSPLIIFVFVFIVNMPAKSAAKPGRQSLKGKGVKKLGKLLFFLVQVMWIKI